LTNKFKDKRKTQPKNYVLISYRFF